MLYIGVDLGTSAVKLLLMDEKGAIKKIVSKEYPLFSLIRAGLSRSRRDWFGADHGRLGRSWLRNVTNHRWRASASADRCTDW